jgi:hypothetical protein
MRAVIQGTIQVKYRPRWGFGHSTLRAVCSVLLALAPVAVSRAQQTWDFTPYRFEIWLAFAASPELTDRLRDQVSQALVNGAELAAGATWDVQVSSCPADVHSDAVTALQTIEVEQIQAVKWNPPAERTPISGEATEPDSRAPAPAAPTLETTASATPAPAVTAPPPPTLDRPASIPPASGTESGGDSASAPVAPSAVEGTAAPRARTSEKSKPAGILRDRDKVVLLSVAVDAAQFVVRARELDSATRRWGPLVTFPVTQPDLLPATCFAAVREAFVPLVRIDGAKGVDVEARARAGGLITRENCLSCVKDGDVLLPFIRRDDRHGEPLPNGIQAAAWTFLTVGGRQGTVLQTKMWSGVRISLAGRGPARTSKLALRMRPALERTDLRLQTAGQSPQPLRGYEVYVKEPNAKSGELLGHSDWRGVVRVPQTDKPLVILQVKSGSQLLAALPMVPGLEREQVATVTNDDPRLAAEAYVKGVQNRVMDTVARRELYTARFRRLIAKKEFDQAKAMLEQIRALETRADLMRQLDFQQQRLATSDRRAQAKIDKLLGDTRQVLNKFLDPHAVNVLSQELEQARRGTPAAAKKT